MPFELIPPGTNIDFIKRRYLCAALSLAIMLAGVIAIPLRGIRLGIDFAGGTEVQVKFAEGAAIDAGEIRRVVEDCGVADSSVVRFGELGASEYLIRFRAGAEPGLAPAGDGCPLSAENLKQLAAAQQAIPEGEDGSNLQVERLKLALGNQIAAVEVERVEFVGPRVGSDLRRAAVYSLGIASLLILVYIGFRFSSRYAPGAVVALFHDVLIVAAIFVIAGWQFDLTVLAALLTIMGYSLNDTIVIYDRIRENLSLHTKHDLIDVLNRSVNQTLSRTILTGGTTFFSCIALFVLGGPVVQPFAIAMAIGIVIGTFSSIYVAAPILLWLEQRTQTARA
jgi:preprotein translocase SecF subunit